MVIVYLLQTQRFHDVERHLIQNLELKADPYYQIKFH
jgi:hypothetical protein